jgi:hypothetical protein
MALPPPHSSDPAVKVPLPTTVHYRTRNDTLREFSTAFPECEVFGFYSGQRVSTPRGDAWVIGVANGQLYFHIDGDKGASKWPSYRRADFQRRGFKVLYDPYARDMFNSVDILAYAHNMNHSRYADTLPPASNPNNDEEPYHARVQTRRRELLQMVDCPEFADVYIYLPDDDSAPADPAANLNYPRHYRRPGARSNTGSYDGGIPSSRSHKQSDPGRVAKVCVPIQPMDVMRTRPLGDVHHTPPHAQTRAFSLMRERRSLPPSEAAAAEQWPDVEEDRLTGPFLRGERRSERSRPVSRQSMHDSAPPSRRKRTRGSAKTVSRTSSSSSIEATPITDAIGAVDPCRVVYAHGVLLAAYSKVRHNTFTISISHDYTHS